MMFEVRGATIHDEHGIALMGKGDEGAGGAWDVLVRLATMPIEELHAVNCLVEARFEAAGIVRTLDDEALEGIVQRIKGAIEDGLAWV